MSAAPADTALRSVAETALDLLPPAAAANLLARWPDRDALVDAIATRAREVLGTGTPDPATCLRACLASLTLDTKGMGVVVKPSAAAATARRYADAPPEALVERLVVVRRFPADEDVLVALLLRMRALRASRDALPDRPPDFLLDLVEPAAALAAQHGTDPAAEADAVRAAVLARAEVLLREHRAVGRPRPAPSSAVIGNADYLLRLAAYRVALAEVAGRPGAVDEALDTAARRLAEVLERAMRAPVGLAAWLTGGAEPDVMAAHDQYVAWLGAAVAGREGGETARRAYVVTTDELHAGAPSPGPAGGDPDAWPGLGRTGPGPAPVVAAEVSALAMRLAAGLFELATPSVFGAIQAWLDGERRPDHQDGLDDLVTALRVAHQRSGECGPPAAFTGRPEHVPAEIFDAAVARLARAVRAEELSGHEHSDALRLARRALPPLWTRRGPVSALLARRLRLGRPRIALTRATVVARAGVRAPMQFVARDSTTPPSCCARDPEATGPAHGADSTALCPHRSWDEEGLVENYATLGAAAGLDPDAARQAVRAWRGDRREWLLCLHTKLTPEQCAPPRDGSGAR